MFSIHPYFLFLWFFSFLLLTLSLHKNTIQGEQKWCYLYSWETSKKGKKSFSTRKWHWQTRLLTKNTTTSTFVIFTQKLVSLPKRTAAVKFLVFLRPTQIPLNLSFSLLLRPWKMVKSRIKPCLSSNQHKRRQRKRQKKEVFFLSHNCLQTVGIVRREGLSLCKTTILQIPKDKCKCRYVELLFCAATLQLFFEAICF